MLKLLVLIYMCEHFPLTIFILVLSVYYNSYIHVTIDKNQNFPVNIIGFTVICLLQSDLLLYVFVNDLMYYIKAIDIVYIFCNLLDYGDIVRLSDLFATMKYSFYFPVAYFDMI